MGFAAAVIFMRPAMLCVAIGFTPTLLRSQEPSSIGLLLPSSKSAYYTEIARGVEDAAGSRGSPVSVADAEFDTFRQVSQFESLVQQGVDVIIVVPVSYDQFAQTALPRAIDAGIRVVLIGVNGPEVDNVIQIDDAVEMDARSLIESISDGRGLSVDDVLVVRSPSGLSGMRADSIVNEIQSSGWAGAGDLQVEEVPDEPTASTESISRILESNSDIAAVIAADSNALMSAIGVVEQGQLQDRVKITGWGLSTPAIAGIEEGYVTGVAQSDPHEIGMNAVSAAHDGAGGRLVLQSHLVVRDTLLRYEELFKPITPAQCCSRKLNCCGDFPDF